MKTKVFVFFQILDAAGHRRNEHAKVSIRVTRMGNYSMSEHIRRALKVDRFGQKVRQSKLVLCGHVKRRDDDVVGRTVVEMQWTGK